MATFSEMLNRLGTLVNPAVGNLITQYTTPTVSPIVAGSARSGSQPFISTRSPIVAGSARSGGVPYITDRNDPRTTYPTPTRVAQPPRQETKKEPESEDLTKLNERIAEYEARGATLSTSDKYADLVERREKLKESEPESLVDQIVAAADKRAADAQKLAKQLFGDSTFSFDEALARESATAEFKPYYSELLDDYLADIEVKRETLEDEKNLASELFDIGTNRLSREYQQAVSNAEEGFAGRGMFFSGLKRRGLGRLEVEQQDVEAERGARREAQLKGFERKGGVLETAEERKERDIERKQKEAIEGGILTRREEAIKQYYTPRVQTFARQFPTSGNVLAGYDIPSYLRF